MKSSRMLLATLTTLAMLGCVHSASAKPRPSGLVGAVPVGSPGDWVTTSDYPSDALRFQITGVTAFRLYIDTAGKPSRCEIVQSSGFDVLDTATCELILARARFTPARNAAGMPAEGTYSNRVRWVTPEGAGLPIGERLFVMLLSIDEAGKIAACKFEQRYPDGGDSSDEDPCARGMKSSPPQMGLELRGNFKGPLAEVEIESADVFTQTLRERFLAPRPGYEQRALFIHNFTVTSDGKLDKCRFEQQRGSIHLANHFCNEAQNEKYDPPFAAIDKDGAASGLHIMRVLLKTGTPAAP